jgi:hypothetical protein
MWQKEGDAVGEGVADLGGVFQQLDHTGHSDVARILSSSREI